MTQWNIEGSRGETIYGTTHHNRQEPKGIVLLAHGFKGYKDYGMFPWLADQFLTAGYSVHRFNFSHSGMQEDDGPFERPDLFEKATWNTQVEDLNILAKKFAQPDIPLILFGHSRGGVAALLAAGRGEVIADRIITLSSPSDCLSMSEENQQRLLECGKIESPSGRTGQMLYVGKCFLEEQHVSPESHDLLSLASGIQTPCLVIHGEDDKTVSASAAETLAETIPRSTLVLIEGGDHVCNTPNPFSVDAQPSTQLHSVWKSISSWL